MIAKKLPFSCLFLATFLLIGCGKGGDTPSPSVALVPGGGNAPAVVEVSSFSGRQYVSSGSTAAGKFCKNDVTTNNLWDCTKFTSSSFANPPLSCNGITIPAEIDLHADTWISVFGVYENSIYKNGQFTLVNSGFTWSMVGKNHWVGSSVWEIVIVVFGEGCAMTYLNGGAV